MIKIGIISVIIIAAGSEPVIPEPWNYVLNYGILAVVLFLILSGKLMVTRREYDALQTRFDIEHSEKVQAIERERELYKEVKGEVVPMLSDVAGRVSDAAKAPTKTAVTIEELAQQVASLTEAMKRR